MVTTPSTGPVHRVREVVEPVVRGAGLHLEDVSVSAAGRRSVVRVVIDLDEEAVGSLDLDTLGEVSRDISAAMDAADPVRGAHVLEVSTPGTDRPLTELRHFRRARTRLVRLTMQDGTQQAGRLLTAEPDGYELETMPGQVVRVDPGTVLRGEVEVELKRVADEASGEEEQS